MGRICWALWVDSQLPCLPGSALSLTSFLVFMAASWIIWVMASLIFSISSSLCFSSSRAWGGHWKRPLPATAPNGATRHRPKMRSRHYLLPRAGAVGSTGPLSLPVPWPLTWLFCRFASSRSCRLLRALWMASNLSLSNSLHLACSSEVCFSKCVFSSLSWLASCSATHNLENAGGQWLPGQRGGDKRGVWYLPHKCQSQHWHGPPLHCLLRMLATQRLARTEPRQSSVQLGRHLS